MKSATRKKRAFLMAGLAAFFLGRTVYCRLHSGGVRINADSTVDTSQNAVA